MNIRAHTSQTPTRLEKRMNKAGGKLYFDDGIFRDSQIRGDQFESVVGTEDWKGLEHSVYVKYRGNKVELDSTEELKAAIDYMAPEPGSKAEFIRSVEDQGFRPQERYDTYSSFDVLLNMGRPAYDTTTNRDAVPLNSYVNSRSDVLFLREAKDGEREALKIRDENWRFKAFEAGTVVEDPSKKFREDRETLQSKGIGFKGARYHKGDNFRDPTLEQLFHQAGRPGRFTIDGTPISDADFVLNPSSGLTDDWSKVESALDHLRTFDRPSKDSLSYLRRHKSENPKAESINLWREQKLARSFEYLDKEAEKSVFLDLAQSGATPTNIDTAMRMLGEGKSPDEVRNFFRKD